MLVETTMSFSFLSLFLMHECTDLLRFELILHNTRSLVSVNLSLPQRKHCTIEICPGFFLVYSHRYKQKQKVLFSRAFISTDHKFLYYSFT